VKAKVRALIILMSLCVIFGSIYVLLPSGKPAPSGRESADDAVLITDIPVGELLALAITSSRGTYGILNSPEGIKIVSDTDGEYSASQMRAFIYIACHLTGRPLNILPEVDDIANSIVRFSLILTGGRENNFAILRKSPVGEDYFLFSEEHQSVFRISGSDAEWFLLNAGDFLE